MKGNASVCRVAGVLCYDRRPTTKISRKRE